MSRSQSFRLAHDLQRLTILSRRQMLGFIGGSTLLAVAGCSGSDDTNDPPGACERIPEETAGPYPGDGTNGKNALTMSGIVRSDIRTSLGGATGVAVGVPLTVTLTLLDTADCAPLAGRAVYLWHCDRAGDYSMYSAAVVNESYLRGVQVSDSEGKVTFTTVFPGCYAGRWPHIHFEVYGSADTPTTGSAAIATSQLALPKAACDAAYATAGYAQSVTNLSQLSLASDGIFRDGSDQQLADTTGNATAGYTATLSLAVTG